MRGLEWFVGEDRAQPEKDRPLGAFNGSVFSALQVSRGKPAPDLFRYAAAQLGVPARRCVVVEDSQYGVAAARAAQMPVIGFAGGITPAHQLAGASQVIVDMADLVDTVGRLLGPDGGGGDGDGDGEENDVAGRPVSPASRDDVGMPARRRVPASDGAAALRQWAADPAGTPRPVLATAVRYTLEELGARAPGRTLEVRVPPYGAVQCIEGPRHTRGTPPNVVETDPQTWLSLVTGRLTWHAARLDGTVRASGERSDLGDRLPLWPGAARPE